MSGSRKYGPKAASLSLAKLLTRDGVNTVVEEDDWYDNLSPANQTVADDLEDESVSWLDAWMSDVSGDNLLRDDLQGRRVAWFLVKKDSQETDRQYHAPIMIDTVTGSRVTRQNNSGGNQGTLSDDGDDSEGDGSADESDAADDRRAELEAMDYSDLQSLGSETEGATGSGSTEDIIESIVNAENDEGAGVVEVPEPIADFVSTCGSLGFTDADRASTLLTDLIEDEGNDLTADMVAEFGGEAEVLAQVEA
jgi:hypothetical protein